MGFTPRLALSRTNKFRIQNSYLFYNCSSKENVKKKYANKTRFTLVQTYSQHR